MKLIKSYSQLFESKATEAQALKILNNSGIPDAEPLVMKMAAGDSSQNQKNLPITAFIFANMGSPNLESIIEVVNDYEDLLVKKRITPIKIEANSLKIGDLSFNDFLKFSEYIHGEKSKYAPKRSSSVESDFQAEDKPIWSGNGIDIYSGDGVGKCIKYTQGGLTGRSYSFCIGQYGNKMYQTYRDKGVSTFFYIIDKNRFKQNPDGSVNLDDPLHIVVFDAKGQGTVELTDANNTTGSISEYGSDTKGYIEYLQSKDVPVDKLLVNRPKTKEEEEEDDLLSETNPDLQWFVRLPFKYKSSYIGRGHGLTDEQFDYLPKDGELQAQYVNTGLGIPEYQYRKLSNNLKKSYLRKIEQSIEQDPSNVEYYYDLTEDKAREFLKNPDMIYYINFQLFSKEFQLEVLEKYKFNPEKFEPSVVSEFLNADEERAKKIISKRPTDLRFIEKPSEEVQKIAVSQYGGAIRYIKNPSKKIQKIAVSNDGAAIKYIENPSEELQEIAVSEKGGAIQYIENPSEELQKIAVSKSPYAIQYIENPSEELQKIVVSKSAYSIEYIENPSEELQKIAVSYDVSAILLIKNPSEKIQMLAVSNDGAAIKYIKNPTQKVKDYVKSKKNITENLKIHKKILSFFEFHS